MQGGEITSWRHLAKINLIAPEMENTAQKVLQKMKSEGKTQTEIARTFNVSQPAISLVKNGQIKGGRLYEMIERYPLFEQMSANIAEFQSQFDRDEARFNGFLWASYIFVGVAFAILAVYIILGGN